MKKQRPPREPEIVEKIVEDLAQQDVLPSDTGADVPASAEPGEEEMASSWNDPPGGKGHRVPPTPMEDESEAAEALVQRGLGEAEDELEELDENENSPEEEG